MSLWQHLVLTYKAYFHWNFYWLSRITRDIMISTQQKLWMICSLSTQAKVGFLCTWLRQVSVILPFLFIFLKPFRLTCYKEKYRTCAQPARLDQYRDTIHKNSTCNIRLASSLISLLCPCAADPYTPGHSVNEDHPPTPTLNQPTPWRLVMCQVLDKMLLGRMVGVWRAVQSPRCNAGWHSRMERGCDVLSESSMWVSAEG